MWFREHTKIRVPEASFRAELLAGHERALRLDEVLGGGELLVRSEEAVRVHGRRREGRWRWWRPRLGARSAAVWRDGRGCWQCLGR